MSSQFIVINEIEELLNEMNDGLAGSIGTINSTVNTINTNMAKQTDLTIVKTNTATNSTESSTGTLSQKLAYLINRRDRIVTPSSTNIKTLSTSLSVNAKSTNEKSVTKSTSSVGAYVKYTGTYRIYATFSTTATHTGDGWADTSLSHKVTMYVKANDKDERVLSVASNCYYKDNNFDATTKYIDVFLFAGSYVSVYFEFFANYFYYSCNGSYNYVDATLNVTNVSIRGTHNEINSATT